jgi:tRNA dimethylallyltransferase
MATARRRGDTELVSVDSMCVYIGMDRGTAKPSPAEQAEVRHHLIDLVPPDEEFTVSQFQAAARAARRDICTRGRRALLVGGTGLYLRAVVDDLALPGRYPEVAAALEVEADGPGGTPALHRRLAALDPRAAERMTPTNRRRIIRALEVTVGSGRPFSSFGPGLSRYPASDIALVGIPFDPVAVDRRIEARFARWLEAGLLEEVAALAARSAGLSRTARQALGYRELLEHLEGEVPLAEAVERAVQRTRAYARRQWAWFRRDPRIRWLSPDEDPVAVLDAALGPRGRPGAAGRLDP